MNGTYPTKISTGISTAFSSVLELHSLIDRLNGDLKISLPPASEGWGKVIFSVCLSVHTRGDPSPRLFPRCLIPAPFLGVRQFQVLSQISGPRSFRGYPISFRGVPQDRGTYPWPGLGYPSGQDLGTPLGQDWGTPHTQDWGTLRDRLRCGWYASWGLPQEDFFALEWSSRFSLTEGNIVTCSSLHCNLYVSILTKLQTNAIVWSQCRWFSADECRFLINNYCCLICTLVRLRIMRLSTWKRYHIAKVQWR